MAQQAFKIVLSTGKTVIIRDLKIKHTELAAQEVAPRAGGDANVLQILMQRALVKQLVVEVDGKRVTASDLEDLDELFNMTEYGQVLRVVGKLMGGTEMGKEPSLEMITSESSGDR